ncbi:MAG: hypothetical protein L0H73_09350 [Nitrococcus sp.]|nr:hypothetical protein [Nitrococcus sp.]
MIFAAAINAGADALITHNIQDFARAAKNFALRVLTPGELLQEWKQ